MDLLANLRLGDEQAFLALYRKFEPAIYRFAVNMTGSKALAEDVTQDVFLALIRENFGYAPDRGTLSGYLFGIARKLVLRHVERGHTTSFAPRGHRGITPGRAFAPAALP